MPFDIREHIEFDAKGRATCPSCLIDGKRSKNLSVLDSGAYKCHRGCTPEMIREALGARKDRPLPPMTQPNTPAAKVTVNPQKVRDACEKLLTQSTHALRWLTDRGISSEMIAHYRLGVVRARVNDTTTNSGYTHLPAVVVPIPTADGTAYFQKKRIAPWMPAEERPDGYQAWSQYGIPQMVYTTHAPSMARETWLCEGEWDAITLGWAVRNSALKDSVQVACFTCGAGNVPPDNELDRLAGKVTIFYDRDEAGEKGSAKVAARLKERCKIATVPALDDAPQGWDISNALDAGLFDAIAAAAAAATPWQPPKTNNPLRHRLISNDELLDRAPDYTDWLVDDILTSDELFLLAASPRAGKSLLAMTLTKAVASGGRFLGRPAAQGAVLYIRCEDSETKTKERELKQGWERGLPVYWIDKFKLSELAHLEELIEELGCRLVVLDTLSRIRDAAISESSAEMSQLLEPLQEMCKRQRCAGLLVHHTGKVNTQNASDIDVFDTIRGSSSIRATCRGTLVLAADERNYRLAVENGWGKHDLQIILDANTLEWRLLGNWQGPNVDLNQKDRVLAYLNQCAAAGIDQIAEACALPKKSLYEVLKRLQAEDLVEKRGERMQAVYVRKASTQIDLLERQFNNSSPPPPNTPENDHPEQGGDQKNAIQQIQQVESLLNGCNPDGVSDRGSIQQKNLTPPPPPKTAKIAKGDQNFDHLSPKTPTPQPGNFVESTPKPLQGNGYGIQQPIQHDSTNPIATIQQPNAQNAETPTGQGLDQFNSPDSTIQQPQFNSPVESPVESFPGGFYVGCKVSSVFSPGWFGVLKGADSANDAALVQWSFDERPVSVDWDDLTILGGGTNG